VRKLPKPLLRDIRRNPGDYYVNVHNGDFPGGAVRGQLESA
jgi:CHRD domain